MFSAFFSNSRTRLLIGKRKKPKQVGSGVLAFVSLPAAASFVCSCVCIHTLTQLCVQPGIAGLVLHNPSPSRQDQEMDILIPC